MGKTVTGIMLAALVMTASPAVAQHTTWGSVDYRGEPWVKCTSRPFDIGSGLDGRHIALWASHGRYYDNTEGEWRWQRPALFATCEDLFTQTIVVPFLIPMLENAGAVVFTPRERDWQRHEAIVDNDAQPTSSLYNYREEGLRHVWSDAPRPGFAHSGGTLTEGCNPFEKGTARQCETTQNKSRMSKATYVPRIEEAGRYAVYVSYQTVEGSVPDAHYTVWHQGRQTEYSVNQRMGGGTWAYLGTFHFDAGCSEQNCVTLTNYSEEKGVVTTDAVRFGGGMGNIERGGKTSGLPRCLEGARYWAQWAGMPQRVYSSKDGGNDYADDINARSLMLNELCGGSVYAPDSTGRGVPIELALAVHSDAGHTDTGLGVYGSLAICTTRKGDSQLAAGKSRQMSRELAGTLLDNVTADLRDCCGQWEARALYDRNYSETRVPVVPSAILETMSHQNFGDMIYGQDPNVRFTLARAIYKSLLQFIATHHGRKYTVQPLPPEKFRIDFTGKEGEVRLAWTEAEPLRGETHAEATPTGYVLYMAQDGGGYDNGTLLRGSSCNVRLTPGAIHRFRVTAVNDGGQSFPTEELAALYTPGAKQTVLVLNGFHRLSAPAVVESGTTPQLPNSPTPQLPNSPAPQQGFDLDADIGVSYGLTAGWIGRQRIFDANRISVEDSTGLGFSTDEMQGRFVMGNTFDYVYTHAEAIGRTGRFNIVSASAQAAETEDLHLKDYAAVDLLLGLERSDSHGIRKYKTFSPYAQLILRDYTAHGGRLLVSGAYVGSDMAENEERAFLADVLKTRLEGVNSDREGTVSGLGMKFSIYRLPDERHYGAHHADIITPATAPKTPDRTDATPPFPAMAYADGTSAAVAYQGSDYRTFTMGFPFECISDTEKRNKLMAGIMRFLLPK